MGAFSGFSSMASFQSSLLWISLGSSTSGGRLAAVWEKLTLLLHGFHSLKFMPRSVLLIETKFQEKAGVCKYS